MRPSCGRRFSEMFSRAMIFMRDTTASLKRETVSGSFSGTRFPSILNLIASAFFCGSM